MMIKAQRAVFWAVISITAMILLTGGQDSVKPIEDTYLSAPGVTPLQDQRMMPAALSPGAVVSRGAKGIDKDKEEDLYLLAKIIECEARYEPYDGKVAVGAVVLNRVMSENFPDTIKGVIYQRGQFQPLTDGGWKNKEPGEEAYRAAMDALAGEKPAGDNGQTVGNALFFIYENLAGKGAAKWFRERLEYVTTIGNHDFYCP